MENPTPKATEEIVKIEKFRFKKEIQLHVPVDLPLMSFTEVLDLRKSRRIFKPISLKTLGEVLYLAARVKKQEMQENGFILTHRPTPSAGARHSVEIIVSSKNLFLNNNLHLYDVYTHTLRELDLSSSSCNDLKSHLLESFPESLDATALWLVAFPERTQAKYNFSESLIWRDIGALATIIHLVCTFLRLNSCLTGTLGYPYLSNLFSEYNIQSGGAIVIGNKFT